MKDRRKMIWEFWQNPYGGYGEEYVSEQDADIPETAWGQNEKKADADDVAVRPVVPTPMGLLPVQSFKNFPDVFEFWIGHTNFYITEEVAETMEFSPGVETLDVFSPYRFRIGIGKAFKGSDVKYLLQKSLKALPPQKSEINPGLIKLDKDTTEKVSLLQSLIKDKHEYWSIYVMPNGQIDVSGSSSLKDYEVSLELYNGALEVAGGIIYTYA